MLLRKSHNLSIKDIADLYAKALSDFDIKQLQKLRKKYPNPDMSYRFSDNSTLLHKIVECTPDKYLHEFCTWAIENGADVNAETKKGFIPAIRRWAYDIESLSAYEPLLQGISAENANKIFPNGHTLATYCARSHMLTSALDNLKILAKHGININKPNADNRTPASFIMSRILHETIFTFPTQARELIDEMRKRNLSFTDADIIEFTSEFQGCPSREYNLNEICEMMRQANLFPTQGRDKNGKTLWHIYATKEHRAVLLKQLEAVPAQESLVNAKDDDGNTPLLAAANVRVRNCYNNVYYYYNTQMKNLIKLGADLTATDSAGNTALHITAANGNIEMAAYLLSLNPALKDIPNNKGKKPLDVAQNNVKPALISLSPTIQAQIDHFQKMSEAEQVRYLAILGTLAPNSAHKANHIISQDIDLSKLQKIDRQNG